MAPDARDSVPEDGRPVFCSWCGTAAPDGVTPATWTIQSSERGMQWLCQTCTRANLRAIESSLPTDYW